MSSTKRQANSPAEKAPGTKKTPIFTTPPARMTTIKKTPVQTFQDLANGSLIKFEVLAINGKPFYGSLAEAEIIHEEDPRSKSK
jgi:hypothetical protein